MACKYDAVLEPIPAEATHIAPPCCVSTHRSRVVDPEGPPTFLDHREAASGIPHMLFLTRSQGAWTPRPLPRRVIASTHLYERAHTGERRDARWHLAAVDQTSDRPHRTEAATRPHFGRQNGKRALIRTVLAHFARICRVYTSPQWFCNKFSYK